MQRREFTVSLVILLVIGGLLAGTASGATINVANGESIQAAIDGANPGDIIEIAAGTYNERPSVPASLTGLTINGAGSGDDPLVDTIIDAGAATSGTYGFSIAADGVTVSNLTLVGDTSLSTPRYGFKPSNVANLTFTNITAREFYRTGVDLLGVTNGALTDVTSVDNGGHGMALTDCNGVTISGLTVSGNAWQGVSVATWGDYSPLGTSGIVFTGANTLTDPFQLEMGDINNPGVPPAGDAIITYSTNLGDGADVTVQAGELAFAVHGEQDDAPGQVRIWLAPTLVDAALLPAYGAVGHFTGVGYFIEDLVATDVIHVTPGCDIQAAIDFADVDDTIQIAAGSYTQMVNVSKKVDIIGAGSGDNPAVDTIIIGGNPQTFSFAASGNSDLDPILIKDLRVEAEDYAFNFTATLTEHIRLENVNVQGNDPVDQTESNVGIKVSTLASVNDLQVVDCAFDHLSYGWYFAKHGDWGPGGSNVTNVTVTGTSFSYNQAKGIYVEKLANVVFTDCTVAENGQDLNFYNATWNAGFDINLKGQELYSGYVFQDCAFTNNGLGAKEGVALTVKGRGTGSDSSYASWPALVDDVLVDGCTFNGNERGVRFGEPGKQNTTPTNVVMRGCTLFGNTPTYGGGDGSAYGDLINMTTADIDAALNWWGDIDPSDQIAAEAGLPLPVVSPWLGAAPGTSPMTWYADATGSIQAAIDAAASGDDIIIAAGTYEEQLHADGKDLTFQGAGIGATILRAPATMAPQYSTSYAHYAVFCVENATAVIDGMTIDGFGRGNGHVRFIGLDMHNAGGDVSNVHLTGIRETPFNGAQHGVAMYTYNEAGGPVTIAVTDCVFDDWQKNATAYNCADGFPLDITVTGCDFTGAGVTDITAQNGLQFWGADVTALVEDCTFTGVAYDNTNAPTPWVASTVLNYYSNVVCRENVFGQAQTAIYDYIGSCDVLDNQIEVIKAGLSGVGLVVTDPEFKPASPYEEPVLKGAPARDKALDAPVITGNTIVFSGPDNTDASGIECYAGYYGDDDIQLTATGNIITGFDYGIILAQYAETPGLLLAADISNNNLGGNNWGAWSDADGIVADATNCWWGAADGPSGEGPGSGAQVSPYIDFDPWRGGVIVSNPDPLDLTVAAPSGSLTVSYLGGYGPIYGYSIDVQWTATLATAGALDFTLPASGPFAGAQAFIVQELAPGHVRIDAAIGGTNPGIDSGDLFAATFTDAGNGAGTTVLDMTVNYVQDYGQPPTVPAPPADDGLLRVDTSLPVVAGVLVYNDTIDSNDWVKNGDTVVVTATVTDGGTLTSVTCNLTEFGGGAAVAADGSPVDDVYTWTFTPVSGTADALVTATVTAVDGVGNSTSLADDIMADNTLPGAVTGVVALPGHNKVHLSWDDPSGLDLNFAGVEFRATSRGEYPVYTNGPADAAADHTEGGLVVFDGTGVDWLQATRDIYTLAAFAYDLAGNYGPADLSDGNWDVATSYFLGDVITQVEEPPVGNGYVNVYDISRLGDAYGLTMPNPDFNDCNVGPTDDWSRFGIPQPDLEVGFFDLMIFAMNFGEVTPATKSDGAIGSPVFAWERVEADTWALHLVNESPGLKGLNISADLPSGVTAMVHAGELVGAQDAPTFLGNVDRNGLDAGLAVMGFGLGFEGSGTLMLVTTSAPVENLEITITARDLNNEELLAELQQTTGVELPAVHALNQNYPNPFNPQTTIKYSLPKDESVRLAVYGVDGRLVRMLVNEVREAGHHEVIWRGDDEAGRRVATGTYFYVINAGDFHQVHKMSLIK